MWRSGGTYRGAAGNKTVGKINSIFGGVHVAYCLKGNRKMSRVALMESPVRIGPDIIVPLSAKNAMPGGGENVPCHSLDYFKTAELSLSRSSLSSGGQDLCISPSTPLEVGACV